MRQASTLARVIHTFFGQLSTPKASLRPVGELMIVAAARTGTNHLCGTLGLFSRCLVLHEIFNEGGAYGLNARRYLLPHFSRLVGHRVGGEEDAALIGFIRQDAKRAMRELARLAFINGEALLAYKLFPAQLPKDTIAELLSERRPAVIFVVRGRLQSYISNLKAAASGRWTNFDSSRIKVEADVDSFLAWAAQRDQWYVDMLAAVEANGLHHLTLSYEDHLDVLGETLVATLASAMGAVNIEVEPPVFRSGRRTFSKQDKTPELFERLANGVRVEQILRSAGRLTYAIGSPMMDSIWPARRSPNLSQVSGEVARSELSPRA